MNKKKKKKKRDERGEMFGNVTRGKRLSKSCIPVLWYLPFFFCVWCACLTGVRYHRHTGFLKKESVFPWMSAACFQVLKMWMLLSLMEKKHNKSRCASRVAEHGLSNPVATRITRACDGSQSCVKKRSFCSTVLWYWGRASTECKYTLRPDSRSIGASLSCMVHLRRPGVKRCYTLPEGKVRSKGPFMLVGEWMLIVSTMPF